MRPSRLLLLAVLHFPLTTSASTYVVDPQGTGDYPTIQAAVDAARDGDEIVLTDGIFTGVGNRNVILGQKRLVIRSESGDPLRTIVDCEHAARGFSFGWSSLSTPPARMEGVTVRHGAAPDFGGAAIVSMYLDLEFRRCIFDRNEAPGNAGAVMVWECSMVDFVECTFTGNTGGAGGAVCT